MNNTLFCNSISGRSGSALRVKSGFRPSVFARKRILLAEDNRVNQLLTCAILKKFGFRTDIANNGKEALIALKSGHYDLVLMDIQMPVIDGIRATEIIRDPNSGISCKIPVIAVTANFSDDDRKRYLAAGMNDCIPKPVEPALLLAAMEKQFAMSAESSDTECKGIQRGSGEKENMKIFFDRDDLLKRLGGDESLCKTLLELFVSTMKETLEQLKASLDAGDAKQVRLYAHSIKGMAANISAYSLCETAYQTEIAGDNTELDKARALTAEMDRLFSGFLSQLSEPEKT